MAIKSVCKEYTGVLINKTTPKVGLLLGGSAYIKGTKWDHFVQWMIAKD